MIKVKDMRKDRKMECFKSMYPMGIRVIQNYDQRLAIEWITKTVLCMMSARKH